MGIKKQKKSLSLKRKITLVILLLLALSPLYYAYVLKVASPALQWVWNIGSNPHYRNYKNFNIRIPDKYPIQGIDVSSYQGVIDWEKVKSMRQDSVHISFAFIKATEGIVQVDPYFERNWRDCKKAGITCGAYHYFRPRFNGKWQAKFFLQNIRPGKNDLPAVVDIEELDGLPPEKVRLELTAFLQEVTLKTKAKPIIYSGLKFYETNLAGHYGGYYLWLSNFDNPELSVTPATNWKFWQHSDRAKVNGITRTVDFDAFKGDSAALKNIIIQ